MKQRLTILAFFIAAVSLAQKVDSKIGTIKIVKAADVDTMPTYQPFDSAISNAFIFNRQRLTRNPVVKVTAEYDFPSKIKWYQRIFSKKKNNITYTVPAPSFYMKKKEYDYTKFFKKNFQFKRLDTVLSDSVVIKVLVKRNGLITPYYGDKTNGWMKMGSIERECLFAIEKIRWWQPTRKIFYTNNKQKVTRRIDSCITFTVYFKETAKEQPVASK